MDMVAKFFTILGFWHAALDEQSSILTTFNTQFCRYLWKRMPFSIGLAPEVFQHRMYEVIEGLEGVDVVTDDFVIVGLGETSEAASKNHDSHLEKFLKRCEERYLRLNDRKFQLRQTKVPFIGHLVTAEGLQVDPHKVKAIVEMLPEIE